jgi:hypothetical protein
VLKGKDGNVIGMDRTSFAKNIFESKPQDLRNVERPRLDDWKM